jgi:hypothetical protein
MKSMLLDWQDTFWMIFGFAFVIVAVVLAVFIAIKINKKYSITNSKIDWSKFDAKGQLKKHTPMLWPKEVEFYQMFRSVLPAEFMIIPKLGVDEIVKPNGSLVAFNEVKDYHVDFCIVNMSNMEPVAVLDTFYPSITDSTMQELDPKVRKALQSANIAVIKYEILDIPYNKTEVLSKFLNAIDPITLAQLNKKK